MVWIFDLEQVGRASSTIGAVAMFRDEALQAHQASMPKQVRAYLALLEVTQEDAVHAARQELREAGFSCRVPGCRTMLPP
jgi:hypothetical protein